MSAVTTDIGLLHSQLPELSLRDLAAAATEQAVQGHVNAAFAALQERLNSGVGMLCQQLSTQQPGARQLWLLKGHACCTTCKLGCPEQPSHTVCSTGSDLWRQGLKAATGLSLQRPPSLNAAALSVGPCCAGLDLQAQVQPLLPAYSYLCDVIQRGTTALLKVRLQLPARCSAQMRIGVAGSCCANPY